MDAPDGGRGCPKGLKPQNTAMSKRGGDSVEQHIEFGDGSAASAALAEAFDYFMRIAPSSHAYA